MLLFVHFLHIFTPLFFPQYDLQAASIATLITFAAGYLFRPIGGIIFGHFGDRLGRTKMLVISILLMAIPTFIIGVCPTYESMGVQASVILFVCRLIQSFSVGGETPGATLILVENAGKSQQNLASAFINIAIQIGGVTAGILGFICTQPSMPKWGWRIPFIIGSLFGVIGFFIRRKLKDTSEFIEAKNQKKILKFPLLEVLHKDKKSILLALGIAAGVLSANQFSITYLSYILRQDFLLLTHQVLCVSSIFMFIMMITLYFMGRLADKIGTKYVMNLGLSAIIGITPLILWAVDKKDVVFFIIMQFFCCVACGALTAPLNVILKSLYTTERRYSGVAFSWGIGMVTFAGCTPLILQFLRNQTGNIIGPSLYVIFCQLLALTAIYFAPNVLQENQKHSHTT